MVKLIMSLRGTDFFQNVKLASVTKAHVFYFLKKKKKKQQPYIKNLKYWDKEHFSQIRLQ